MTNESPDKSRLRIDRYIDTLKRLFEGNNWLDESFTKKLKDVDEQHAFAVPVPGFHSIAEIVWHCIYWKRVVIKHLEGDHDYKKKTVKQQNFLPAEELKAKGWTFLRDELFNTQTELLTLLGSLTDYSLDQEYHPGYTHEFLLEGIVQHDAYHLGQIGLVNKLIVKR